VATLEGRTIAPASAAATPAAEAAAVTAPVKPQAIVVHVPKGSSVPAADLERIAVRAHESLSKTLGTSVMPVTIELHDTLDSFRYETGRPWWVSAAITGSTVDLAPAPLLIQREGVEMTVRTAMAELLVSSALADRPLWTRVGAARYFARPSRPATPSKPVSCPVDAELRMAVSYSAQREAEQRAERCFAYALARVGDWKAVR
jgi:hypothetical protein